MDDILLRYYHVMTEINDRHEAIYSIIDNKVSTGHIVTDLEFIALQYRKILELIMMASLVVNSKKYGQISKKVRKMYSISDIEKVVKKFNSEFFPVPLKRIKHNDKYMLSIGDYCDDNMNYSELCNAWGICSEILHAKNPFGDKINYDKYEEKISYYHNKTVGLLQEHSVLLSNKDRLCVIMKSNETGKPSVRYFSVQ